MKRLARLPEREEMCFAEASAWQLRLARDPSLELSAEFQAWLANPKNERAFAGVTTAWRVADQFPVDPDLLEMRQAALRRARAASMSRRISAFTMRRAVAFALIGIAMVGSGLGIYLATAPVVYATSRGERRIVLLSDGSQIELDSDTEVRVRYAKNARNLVLENGRASFNVAHNVARPFSVTAGAETVVAVGTSFEVEKIGPKVMVTLIHGQVVVRMHQPSLDNTQLQPPVSLRAGQELVSTDGFRRVTKTINLSEATAWESGRLVFSGDTLAEAVARENRYTRRQIEVDPAIATIRIVGSFYAGDVASFVSGVTSDFPIDAETTADGTILLRARH